MKPVRADEIPTPGSIIEQIKYYAAYSEVFIADITGKNPNVLYEIGIRHGAKGKAILLTQNINDIPFNLTTDRVIHYDPKSLRDSTKAKQELERVLDEVLRVTTMEC